MDLELYIFDANLNRKGIIDTYEKVEFELNYEKHSLCFLTVEGTARNIELLLQDEIRIIARSDDLNRGYMVESAEFIDEAKTEINIIAWSMSFITSWRTIERQQRYTGNVEDVIKAFINANCINPTNSKRKIPNLVLGFNTGINIDTEITHSHKQLDDALWPDCMANEMSFEILLNHNAKKFVFSTYQGVDRSAQQNINSHVIFAKAFDNVAKQSYTNDKSSYKTTAYVAGEGEGVARKVVTIGDEHEGLNRRELFVDARDLQAKYEDDNGQEVILNEEQYIETLRKRGKAKQAEYQHVRTFTSDIDLMTRFIFGRDYFIGDKVTIRNDELGVVMHTRVTTAKETFDRSGYDLKIDFGNAIPTLIDKLKREVK